MDPVSIAVLGTMALIGGLMFSDFSDDSYDDYRANSQMRNELARYKSDLDKAREAQSADRRHFEQVFKTQQDGFNKQSDIMRKQLSTMFGQNDALKNQLATQAQEAQRNYNIANPNRSYANGVIGNTSGIGRKGVAGTYLTGNQGIDLNALKLGKKTLLGL